jgi:hypothetical protein
MSEEMTASGRFGNLVRGKSFDRLPAIEWAPWWDLTINRWRKEGLPGELVYRNIQLYFGLDGCVQTNFGVRTKDTPERLPMGPGYCGPLMAGNISAGLRKPELKGTPSIGLPLRVFSGIPGNFLG